METTVISFDESDWKHFMNYFDQNYPGFFANLKKFCPAIGLTYLKLAALLRLNLDTKQISEFLGFSVECTKVLRYKLRKKLRLSEENNLTEYLSNF